MRRHSFNLLRWRQRWVKGKGYILGRYLVLQLVKTQWSLLENIFSLLILRNQLTNPNHFSSQTKKHFIQWFDFIFSSSSQFKYEQTLYFQIDNIVYAFITHHIIIFISFIPFHQNLYTIVIANIYWITHKQ